MRVAAVDGGSRRRRNRRSGCDSRTGQCCSPWRLDVVEDQLAGGLEVVEDELVVAGRLEVVEGEGGAGGGNGGVTS